MEPISTSHAKSDRSRPMFRQALINSDLCIQPCRRCQRENKECVLGESHRGGRRVRKKPKLEEGAGSNSPAPSNTQPSAFNSPGNPTPNYSPIPGQHTPQQSSQPFHSRYDTRQEPPFPWQQPTPTNTVVSDTASRHTDQTRVSDSHLQGPYSRSLN